MSDGIQFTTSDGSTILLGLDGIQVIPWRSEGEVFGTYEDRTIFALAFEHDIEVLERMLEFARCVKKLADAETQDRIDFPPEGEQQAKVEQAVIVANGSPALNDFALK
jgi:hypothetical protein